MTERLAESNLSVRELQGELVQAQRQLARTQREAGDAVTRVAELERSIETLRAERAAEEADALASWEAEGGPETGEPERGSVDELVTWEAKAAEIQAEQDEIKRVVKGA
jgi:capsule polysaccharide export protein KpsE/RkpR